MYMYKYMYIHRYIEVLIRILMLNGSPAEPIWYLQYVWEIMSQIRCVFVGKMFVFKQFLKNENGMIKSLQSGIHTGFLLLGGGEGGRP